jgi:adenosylhomocysteine nucleosidase
MSDMVIFTALGWERRAVTVALGAEPTGGPGIWQATLADGSRCRIIHTGVGANRARAAAEAAPAAGLFLTCGCAGGLVDWLRPGDLVAAESVIGLDEPGAGSALPAVGGTLATSGSARGFRVHVGAVASSPGVLASPAAKAAAGAGGALVVDMESAAVAAVAVARGVPFTALRVVLDVLGDGLPSGQGIVDEASGEVRPVRAAVHFATRPWLWRTTGRLARQQRVAARRLGEFVSGVLGAGVTVPAGWAPRAASSGGD